MDLKAFFFAVLLLAVAISNVATSSIGMDCANKSKTYKKENENNYTWLMSQLGCALCVAIIALIGIYLAFSDKKPSLTSTKPAAPAAAPAAAK